jgi:hypothetical protein
MKKAVAACMLVCACPASQAPAGSAGPVEAVQDFAAALQKGDTAAAWSLLSTRTQEEAGRVAMAAMPDAGPEAGRQMLFNSALPGRPVNPRVISQTDDSAEVQTADDGGARTFHVVREGGRWRVDLPVRR